MWITPEPINRNVYDGTPPQGLSEARRVGGFLNCLLLILCGSNLSGAAAIIVNDGVLKNLVSYMNSPILIGNAQLQAKRWKGVSPLPLWFPRCDNSKTVATSSSLSAEAVWGDRHRLLLRSYQHLEFHFYGKGNLQSR
jgi:hypothetical protein